MFHDTSGIAVEAHRSADDIKLIRHRCHRIEDWQDQVLLSLHASGWNFDMLCWLPVAHPQNWFSLLRLFAEECERNGQTEFNQSSVVTDMIETHCGQDRDKWLTCAVKTLVERGWLKTMVAKAFNIERRKVLRRL